MKTSSDRPAPDVPDRASARACTLTNLLVLPGLGSLVAGRRVGWAQLVLALAGVGLFGYGLWRLLRDWLASEGPVFEFTRGLGALLAGLGLSLAAWVWALVTSLQVHRAAREGESAPAAAAPPRRRGGVDANPAGDPGSSGA